MRRYASYGLVLLCIPVLALGCAAGKKEGEVAVKRPPRGYIKTGTSVDDFTGEAADVYGSFLDLEARFSAIIAKIDDIQAKYGSPEKAEATLEEKVQDLVRSGRVPENEFKTLRKEVEEALDEGHELVTSATDLLPRAKEALSGLPKDPLKLRRAKKAVDRAEAQLYYIKSNGSELSESAVMILQALAPSP